jgi:hypothetical protein
MGSCAATPQFRVFLGGVIEGLRAAGRLASEAVGKICSSHYGAPVR